MKFLNLDLNLGFYISKPEIDLDLSYDHILKIF